MPGIGNVRAGACLLFLALHAAAILLDPGDKGAYGYPFLIAAPWLGILGIWRLSRGTGATVWLAWLLLAGALVVWDVGTLASAWADLALGSSPLIADAADFFYISYGVVIVAALALPDRRTMLSRLAWIDIAQGVLAAVLCYVAVFAVLPFSSHPPLPISTGRMVRLYTVENLGLLLLAAVRVLGRSQSPARVGFDRVLLLFLSLYAVCAGLFNAYSIQTSFSPGLAALLVDLPFLGLLLLQPGRRPAEQAVTLPRRPVTVLVDGATKAFFTLALLWLSVSIAQTRFVLGSMAMILSLALMVSRSALLESHHLETQDALAQARDRLLHLSRHDDLTGVANRRAFEAALAEGWTHLEGGEAAALSLLLIDIDYFKSINDRLGHDAGDECLRMVATALSEALKRPEDRLFRYGGEEFAVLLPGTLPVGAIGVAEILRASVSNLAIPNRSQTGDRVTISIGVASMVPGEGTPSGLTAAADRALYRAKAGGRDRVFGGGIGGVVES